MKVEHEVIIEKLSHDGRGIAHIEGKTCFVSHALPGERVRIAIKMSKRNYSEATTLSVLSQGNSRVTPECPHFMVCGGCSLQHVSQDEQIALKQSVLLEQLKHFGQIVPQTLLEPLRDAPYHYRRKARIGLKYVPKLQKVVIGFREKQGRYITDSQTCSVIHPALEKLWEPLRQIVEKLSIKNEVPQVECAVGDTQVAIVMRHLQPLSPADEALLIDFAQAYQLDFYLQPKGPASVHQIFPPNGKARLMVSLPACGVQLQAHPLDFLQVNRAVNEKMICQAMELLDLNEEDKVLDLFCGLGNFTLPMAKRVHSVVGVEGDAEMVSRIQENAQLNGCDNVEGYAADLFQDCSHESWAKQTYTKILIDPPRAGAQEILPLMKVFQPEKICYVSCNPATLARDAGILSQMGYRLEAAGVMDMFTHTHHTEAMALFIRT